jgi:alkylated DNA repair dioxygenase AlkB
MFLNSISNILPHNGEVYLYTNLFEPTESKRWIEALLRDIQWQQSEIKMFGKTLKIPRLNAWYGDEGKMYSYSGISLSPLPWTPDLLEIKKKVEEISNVRFNGALVNLYRNGKDSMGWHRDNEKELGQNPVIASVSLGATRAFRFRNINNKKHLIKLPLTHGSLLLMSGESQHYWEHDIPKELKIQEPRINITFRTIV